MSTCDRAASVAALSDELVRDLGPEAALPILERMRLDMIVFGDSYLKAVRDPATGRLTSVSVLASYDPEVETLFKRTRS